jgi:hypothetical protein
MAIALGRTKGVVAMPAKKPKAEEKPQRERFIEAARKAEASENPGDFEGVFNKIVRPIEATLRDQED